MSERAPQQKVRVGRIVGDKMDKTVVVSVERRVQHPLYKKSIRRKRNLIAHDESNNYSVGDVVRIVETRPLSATKRWRVTELISRPEAPAAEVEEAPAAEVEEAPAAEVEETPAAEVEEAPAAEVEEAAEGDSKEAKQ